MFRQRSSLRGTDEYFLLCCYKNLPRMQVKIFIEERMGEQRSHPFLRTVISQPVHDSRHKKIAAAPEMNMPRSSEFGR